MPLTYTTGGLLQSQLLSWAFPERLSHALRPGVPSAALQEYSALLPPPAPLPPLARGAAPAGSPLPPRAAPPDGALAQGTPLDGADEPGRRAGRAAEFSSQPPAVRCFAFLRRFSLVLRSAPSFRCTGTEYLPLWRRSKMMGPRSEAGNKKMHINEAESTNSA